MHEYPGARLALLLLAGFDKLVDQVEAELVERGHEGVSSTLEFALRAINAGATTAVELGRRLGVSRQAAARTIETLERMGYVDRVPNPLDGRSKQLVVTDRGREMDAIAGEAFDRLRDRLVSEIGPETVTELERVLVTVNGGEPRSMVGDIAGSRVSPRG